MKNEIETISDDLKSAGNFNCVLSFESPYSFLLEVNQDVTKLFNPDEINASLFDLDNQQVHFVDNVRSFKVGNSIKRLQFIRKDEQIIVEYYKGRLIIEHLFSASRVSKANGKDVINKYFHEKENVILVLGFELSLPIDSFMDSLNMSKTDSSVHPILMIAKNESGFVKEDYSSDSSEINLLKTKLILKYFDDLRLRR